MSDVYGQSKSASHTAYNIGNIFKRQSQSRLQMEGQELILELQDISDSFEADFTAALHDVHTISGLKKFQKSYDKEYSTLVRGAVNRIDSNKLDGERSYLNLVGENFISSNRNHITQFINNNVNQKYSEIAVDQLSNSIERNYGLTADQTGTFTEEQLKRLSDDIRISRGAIDGLSHDPQFNARTDAMVNNVILGFVNDRLTIRNDDGTYHVLDNEGIANLQKLVSENTEGMLAGDIAHMNKRITELNNQNVMKNVLTDVSQVMTDNSLDNEYKADILELYRLVVERHDNITVPQHQEFLTNMPVEASNVVRQLYGQSVITSDDSDADIQIKNDALLTAMRADYSNKLDGQGEYDIQRLLEKDIIRNREGGSGELELSVKIREDINRAIRSVIRSSNQESVAKMRSIEVQELFIAGRRPLFDADGIIRRDENGDMLTEPIHGEYLDPGDIERLAKSFFDGFVDVRFGNNANIQTLENTLNWPLDALLAHTIDTETRAAQEKNNNTVNNQLNLSNQREVDALISKIDNIFTKGQLEGSAQKNDKNKFRDIVSDGIFSTIIENLTDFPHEFQSKWTDSYLPKAKEWMFEDLNDTVKGLDLKGNVSINIHTDTVYSQPIYTINYSIGNETFEKMITISPLQTNRSPGGRLTFKVVDSVSDIIDEKYIADLVPFLGSIFLSDQEKFTAHAKNHPTGDEQPITATDNDQSKLY